MHADRDSVTPPTPLTIVYTCSESASWRIKSAYTLDRLVVYEEKRYTLQVIELRNFTTLTGNSKTVSWQPVSIFSFMAIFAPVFDAGSDDAVQLCSATGMDAPHAKGRNHTLHPKPSRGPL